jgi:tRNA(Ile2) C34 agmatinyltransferase TiaS
MTQPPPQPESNPRDDTTRTPVCQFCLADTRHTEIAGHLPQDQRCPVCGAAYTGPRRDAHFRALLHAGLVAVES